MVIFRISEVKHNNKGHKFVKKSLIYDKTHQSKNVQYKKRQFKVDGFEWTDGTAVDFTSWQNGEPNNAGGNENCVESSGTGNMKDNLYN